MVASRAVRHMLITAGLASTVSCGAVSTTTAIAVDPIVGTFNVQSENGKPLPVQQSPTKTFLSGVLVVNVDKTLKFTMQFQQSTGNRTEIRPGTWTTTATGYTLSFGADLADPVAHPAEVHSATVSGNTMTIPDAAIVLVRQ